jgi:hypothetical protein
MEKVFKGTDMANEGYTNGVVGNTKTTERGGGVNQLYVSLNNFIPFKTLLIFLHVSSTIYNIWTVKVKIISHT